jgi:hypothetical protein
MIDSIAGGADQNMQAVLSQLRNGVAAKSVLLQQTEQSLESLKLLQDSTGLPTVPDALTIQNQAANIQGNVNVKLQELSNLPGGACLQGALNSVASVANEGYAFIAEQMSGLIGAAGVPADVMNISGVFGEIREKIGSLGLEKYAAAALGTMGCLADDSAAVAELQSLMGQLGMDEAGKITDEKFQQTMMADLTAKAGEIGVDTSWVTDMSDSMGEMSKMANGFADQAKTEAATQIGNVKQGIKDAVSKVPTPPSIF